MWVASCVLPVFIQARANSEGGVLAGTVQMSSVAKGENVVVYLDGVTGTHPVREKPAVMDQKDLLFAPHILPVQQGQTVTFSNSEPVTHNVHVFLRGRTILNATHFLGQDREWIASRAGEYDVRCNIHREMSAYILVLGHPFFAAVGPQNSPPSQFRIEGIPEGTYTLVTVRDKKGELERVEQKVTIKEKQVTTVSLTVPN